jgi:PAS domain S-box-containing protein
MVAFASLPIGAFALAVGAVTGSDLRIWGVTTVVMFAAARAQLSMGRPHPPALMAIGSTVLMLGTMVSDPDAVPAIAAGVLAVGLAVIMAFSPSKRSVPYVVWITTTTGVTLWWGHRSWSFLVGFAALTIAVAIAWFVLRAAGNALWKAERRYRQIFENASYGLVVCDVDLGIVTVNERASRAFSQNRADLVGQPVSMVLPDIELIAGIAAARDATPITSVGRRRDGSEFPVELTANNLDTDGESLCLVSVRDISEQVSAERRARRGERVYRDLFESVPIGLYRTAPEGEILDANPALAHILGYGSVGHLLGTNTKAIFADAADRERQTDELDNTEGAVRSELRLRRSDGRIIWVRDRARAVRDAEGRVVRYEGAIQDVTDEHHAIARLEREIRSKTELVAAVSHELRTPLTAVLGFIELLVEDRHQPSEERGEYLRLASEQANELAFLIEDLLTSAHLEHDELVVSPGTVDLWDTVAAAIAALGSRTDLEITSSVEPGLFACCDPRRVRQILRNLLSNAISHGAPPVRLSGSTRAGTVEITVTDHGPGIRSDAAERVFDAFFRGHDAKTTPNSIGIGLAVSRRLARVMDGDLTYQRQGDVTRFVLTLPAAGVDGRSGEGTDSEAAVA